MVPWAMLTGVWEGIHYPLSASYTTWVGDIILGITNIFIAQYYLAIPKVFKEINQKGVLKDGTITFTKFQKDIDAFYKHKAYYWILFLSFIISLSFHFVYLEDQKYGWTEVNATGGWSLLGYYHMLYFTIELSIILNCLYIFFKTIKVFKLLRNYIAAKKLSYIYIRLCRYHAGGLKPFGDLAMRFNTLIFTLGIYSTTILATVILFNLSGVKEQAGLYLWEIVEVGITLTLYFLLAPTFFFLHLLPIHKIMKIKKEEFYDQLIAKDLTLFDFSEESLDEVLKNRRIMTQLIQHSDLSKIIQDFPAWPFNIRTITTLITTTVFPALPIIFKLLYNFLGTALL